MGEWNLLVLGFLLFAMVEDSGGKVVDGKVWETCCPSAYGCPRLPSPWNDDARYKMICQYYKNRSHYATLFDTTARIPVFSCFNITTIKSKERRQSYDNEPQLVHLKLPQNMMSESNLTKKRINNDPITKDQIKQHQAVNQDYLQGDGYHKGHLNPAGSHENLETVNSTNTFTNVVPQVGTFNQGCWRSLELRTRKYVMTMCEKNHTVVVGAVPSPMDWMDRVNKPSYMWSYVNCSGTVTAFFVPNTANEDIKGDSLLRMFEYRDKNMVWNFLNHMASRDVTQRHENYKELMMDSEESSTNPLIDKSICTFNTHYRYYNCRCSSIKRKRLHQEVFVKSIRQKDSSEDSAEDTSMDSAEYSSMDSAEDLSMDSSEDSSMDSAKDLSTDSSEDLSTDSSEDSSTDSSEDSSNEEN